MGDDGRDGALPEARMGLLEQIAETVDDRGFYDTRRVVRAAPDESSRQAARDGLLDLQEAGLLVVKSGADFDSDPLTVSTRGRSALTERQRLRNDPFSTNRACRIAVAKWLYNVKHRGGRDGNWRQFTEAEGNVWLGKPFPETALAEASRWLFDCGFIRGRVQQATRGHRGRTGDPLYRSRRTLHTGEDLLTDRQRDRTGRSRGPLPIRWCTSLTAPVCRLAAGSSGSCTVPRSAAADAFPALGGGPRWPGRRSLHRRS